MDNETKDAIGRLARELIKLREIVSQQQQQIAKLMEMVGGAKSDDAVFFSGDEDA